MPKVAPSQDATAADTVGGARAATAAVLAWLIPGAGHFYLGRRRRAGLFFLLITGSVLLGASLDGKLQTTFQGLLDSLATVASVGTGLAYFALRFLLGHTGEISSAGYEYGGAFLLTAGLMNLLLVIDSWDIAHGRKV